MDTEITNQLAKDPDAESALSTPTCMRTCLCPLFLLLGRFPLLLNNFSSELNNLASFHTIDEHPLAPVQQSPSALTTILGERGWPS